MPKQTKWNIKIIVGTLIIFLAITLNFINPFHLLPSPHSLYPNVILPETLTGIWRPVYTRDNQEPNIHHIHFPHAASSRGCDEKTTGMQVNLVQKDHVLDITMLGSKEYRDFSPPDFTCYYSYRPVPKNIACLLYTSPSPRDRTRSRMPSSA